MLAVVEPDAPGCTPVGPPDSVTSARPAASPVPSAAVRSLTVLPSASRASWASCSSLPTLGRHTLVSPAGMLAGTSKAYSLPSIARSWPPPEAPELDGAAEAPALGAYEGALDGATLEALLAAALAAALGGVDAAADAADEGAPLPPLLEQAANNSVAAAARPRTDRDVPRRAIRRGEAAGRVTGASPSRRSS